MTKFVCRRDDIYAGLLMLNNQSNEEMEATIKNGFNNYNLCCRDKIIRGVLFNIDDFGNANDLIYDVGMSYPVLFLSSKNNFTYYINHCVKLDELLIHLGYSEFLKQSDLNKIYKKFIVNDKWLINNVELFGYLKLAGGGYGEGGLEIVSSDIFNTLRFIENFYKPISFRDRTIISRNKLVKRR